MSGEEWVREAMSDDFLVAEVLLCLHQAPQLERSPAPALKLDWSVRQRRSGPAPRRPVEAEKKGNATRASPTTPLSLSGGASATSHSGGGVGFEESSKPQSKTLDRARSELLQRSAAWKPAPRRTGRRKTLNELKNEEFFLLKDRKRLRDEVEIVRVTIEKQRAVNERLKRRKLDLQSQHFSRPHQTESASKPSTGPLTCAYDNAALQTSLPNKSLEVLQINRQGAPFLLPDLNLSVEDGSSSL